MIRAVFFLFFCSLEIHSSSAAELIKLKVGEIVSVRLWERGQLKVSRKGVLEIEPKSQDLWNIYGLKKGAVTISQMEGSRVLNKKMILVEAAATEDRYGIFASSWKDFICRHRGIRCHERSHKISGMTDHWRWFYQVKKQCKKKSPCLFKVRLSERGRFALKSWLKAARGLVVSVMEDGSMIVNDACKTSKDILPMMIRDEAHFPCLPRQENLLVTAKIYWLKKAEADQFGLRPWNYLRENLLVPGPHKLQSARSLSCKRLIAHPSFLVKSGQTVKSRQGLDQVIHREDQKSSEVLKSGLNMQFKVTERFDGFVKAHIVTKLRLPTGLQQRYEVSEFDAVVDLPLSESVVVASFDMNLDQEDSDQIGFLQGIPIFSLLFQERSESKAFAKLRLELEIRLASNSQLASSQSPLKEKCSTI